jgi:DNA polymerase III subunit epsilon
VNRYAIIDVETTGGSARQEKIIEIAIQLVENGSVVKEFQSLINPERSVPSFITQLTGINNEMVQHAPKFYEIAREVIEITENAVFVAHNVRFDYGFIQEEFRRLGYTFSRKQLCTVRMSRKAFPGLRSYSLGNLIKHFNISVSDRHRAMADVMATSTIFSMILDQQNETDSSSVFLKEAYKNVSLPPSLNFDQLETLPEKTGVYYMLDEDEQVVYVGKSVNIRTRIRQHFQNINPKSNKLYQRVHQIRYELTGSEMIACLLENQEIKALQPEINRAARVNTYPYFIYLFSDANDYLCFDIEKNTVVNRKTKRFISEHHTLLSAKQHLKWIRDEYQLCSKLMGVNKDDHSCFEYKIGKCQGACQQLEDAESYNERVFAATQNQGKITPCNLILLDTGRSPDEMAVAVVRNGDFWGFDYISTDQSFVHPSDMAEMIRKTAFYPDQNTILKRFIQKPWNIRIIPFETTDFNP